MLEPLDEWNPFDILLERNSSVRTQPDITFLSNQKLVPVVGVCLVEPYGAPFEELACAAIEKFIASKHISVIQIDTRLDQNRTGLRSSAEIESVLARMDLVITTRLHGTVLSLKNGIPTISIDLGGDSLKIKRQAEKIGWPIVFTGDEVNEQKLQQAFNYCLTQEARLKAKSCSDFAKTMVEEIRNEFINSLTHFEPQTHNEIDNFSSKEKIIKPTNKNSTDRIFTDLPLDITWKDSKVPDKSLMTELRQRLKSLLFST